MSNEGGVQRSLVCKDEFNVENVGQIPDGCQSRPKPITRPLGGQRRDSSVSHAPTRPAVQSAIVPDANVAARAAAPGSARTRAKPRHVALARSEAGEHHEGREVVVKPRQGRRQPLGLLPPAEFKEVVRGAGQRRRGRLFRRDDPDAHLLLRQRRVVGQLERDRLQPRRWHRRPQQLRREAVRRHRRLLRQAALQPRERAFKAAPREEDDVGESEPAAISRAAAADGAA